MHAAILMMHSGQQLADSACIGSNQGRKAQSPSITGPFRLMAAKGHRPLPDRVVDATQQLNECSYVLGKRTFNIMIKVVGPGTEIADIAKTQREKTTFSDYIKDGLKELAVHWGYKTRWIVARLSELRYILYRGYLRKVAECFSIVLWDAFLLDIYSQVWCNSGYYRSS